MAPVPEDLQLEIVVRCDAKTIIRCAATSKHLRRAILDEDFRRRLARLAAANGGFDPRFLLAVSAHQIKVRKETDGQSVLTVDAVQVPPSLPRMLRLCVTAAAAEKPLETLCSRDGLIVLRRGRGKFDDLYVCNAFTGHVTCLPRMAIVRDVGYAPALLTVGDTSHSFEILVAGSNLQTQTFSSRDGRWSAVRAAQLPYDGWRRYDMYRGYPAPAVIERTVYWLICMRKSDDDPDMMNILSEYDDDEEDEDDEEYDDEDNFTTTTILALHADTARATTIKLPEICAGADTTLLLGASPDGRLRLFDAVGGYGIVMWTLSAEKPRRWSEQLVISMQAIYKQLRFLGRSPCSGRFGEFGGFGERSGTVVMEVKGLGLVQLNLVTKKVVLLRRINHGCDAIWQTCLHEINMISLLQTMKSF